MSSLLLIISLLLHVVAFYLIYMMYIQLQQFKNKETDEITEILDHYLQDIKNENDRLQHELKRNLEPVESNTSSVMMKEDQVIEKSESTLSETVPTDSLIPDTELINDSMETSLEAKVLQLHKKGFSITDIAKKLDCGKTEAELIIQFYEQKKG